MTPSSIGLRTSASEDDVRRALKEVIDPEIGVNIVDLGLVYGITFDDGGLHIALTMTSPACPMGELIVDDVHAALDAAMPPGLPVDVELVWEPPWEPRMMSRAARDALGWEDA